MKKVIIIASLVLSIVTANANVEKTYKSKVEKATVYLQGAQLFHGADVSLPAGSSDVVIEGVSPSLDQQSLQASGKGNFTIIDVHFNVKYPEEVIETPKKTATKYLKLMKAYEDSLGEMDFLIMANADKKTQFDIVKNLLLSNRLIKGEFKRDSLSILKDAMDYLRIRLANINAELLKVRREANKLSKENIRITERYNELQELANKVDENPEPKAQEPIYQVVVSVVTDIAVQGKININYFVANASWNPEYELKANNINSQIQFVQKANVQQTTGIDWSDVKMTLSSGNPSLNNNKPELTSFYLNFYQPYRNISTNETLKAMPKMASSGYDAVMEDAKDYSAVTYSNNLSNAGNASNFTIAVENRTRVDYTIDLKYSIPTDGKSHQVAINKKDINAIFEYYAAPKLDNDAFLIAKITDWENLNILPGNARIYFDGSFVGKTFINVNNADDTLALSLGRDNNIDVTRTKLKQKTKNLVASNDKIITETFTIVVRNNKQSTTNIDVEDMLPLSNNENIEIKIIEVDGAKYNETTGSAVWNVNVKPHESKKITYSYEVRFPRDKALSGM